MGADDFGEPGVHMNHEGALSTKRTRWGLGAAAAVIAIAGLGAAGFGREMLDTGRFVVRALLAVAPLVVPGILIAAWVSASGAGGRIADRFDAGAVPAIVMASFIGALTPVCGVTVLPLMVGLLAAGVPLAPVMAFWLSSPITDPAMLAATAATLGTGFAVGKTVIAFALGVGGGLGTHLLAATTWTAPALRDNGLVRTLGRTEGCGDPAGFDVAVWRSAARRRAFRREAWATARLVVICLTPAFAAEYWLNKTLAPDALSGYLGADAWWAVPITVVVGAPAYLDGYAALPLVRGLMDHGMSSAAAMAFLISGGVVSIWGAMAIFPVLRFKPFVLFLGFAVFGSMAAGWAFGALS